MESGNTVMIIILALSVAWIQVFKVSATVERCQQNISDANFVNNGYEGIVIRIAEDVPEDYTLVNDLQQLLVNMSETLFYATKRRAFIRQVDVLLPRSWGKPPNEMSNITKYATTAFSGVKGDIKVYHRSPKSENEEISWTPGDDVAYIDPPYVIKPTPCGYAGQYLRLTPEFIRFVNHKSVTDVYGDHGKIMLRQWAKLRWGVYDEIPPDGLKSHFYRHTDLTISPASCSRAIPGKRINSGKLTRHCSSEEALQDQECVFEPSQTTADGNTFASLMHRSDRHYIQHFCDNANSEIPVEMQHNDEAPTIHNLHCQGKSIWEVMREHADFKQGNNPSLPEDYFLPPVQINLIRNPVRRIVMVLDTSTSMRKFERLTLLRQAASQFIDTVPEKSWIGIVSFNVEAQVLSTLTEINSDEDRTLLKKRLPSLTSQGTSIGSGIRKGLQLLERTSSKYMSGPGGTLLVLSDGKEHNRPKITDVMNNILESGVRINTIAFGSQVSADLETLATATGGSSYFASSGDFANNNELRAAFLATIENDEDGTIMVSSASIRIQPGTTSGHVFIIDEKIGRQTRITVLYTNSVAPKVGLQRPEGVIVWEDDIDANVTDPSIQFSWDGEFSTKVIKYDEDMETGEWKVVIANPALLDPMTVDITVFSRPTSNNEGLVLSPALLCRQINFTGSENIVIYAHLGLGEFAVIDAEVQATVTRPLTRSGTYDTSSLALKDDGRGADVIANDGVYSGYFTSFTLEGRYNVKVNASSTGMARIAPNYILGIGRLREPSITIDTKNLTAISRTNVAGKWRRRRSIKFGFLRPFSRGSTQQKEFIVETAKAIVCQAGYDHFQDSCYKHVSFPLKTAKAAATFCETEGGYPAIADSHQEYNYLLASVSGSDTWFGGVDESLTIDGSIPHVRIKRRAEDEDLMALADVFATESLSDEFRKVIESFEPDLKGLSRKEINGIIRRLGITSESQIEWLKQSKLNSYYPNSVVTTPPIYAGRRKRKSNVSREESAITDSNAGRSSTATTTMLSHNVTLALAMKEPDKVEFDASGNEAQECSWISDGNVFSTSSEACHRPKAFFCERPKKDIVPPSRINDFRLTQNPNNSQLVNFSWTATGDDGTIGTATRYEIRSLRTSKARILQNNFKLGDEILSGAILEGTVLSPKNSGAEEELVVNQSRSSECPPHAAVDVILFVPKRLTSQKQSLPTERDGYEMLLTSLLDSVKISEYEVQITIVVYDGEAGNVVIQDSIDRTKITKAALNFGDDSLQGNLTSIFEELPNAGRARSPKLGVMILSNEELITIPALKTGIQFVNVVVIGVSISESKLVSSSVREPTCENAVFVNDWREINSSVSDIVNQICRARTDEYQAWGIIAVDDEGLEGSVSNIISSVIRNQADHVTCPMEKATKLPAVAEGSSSVLGIAIGVPLAVIAAIIGSIMLFGQIRKYKRKLDLEKRRKREAEESGQRDRTRGVFTKSNKTAPIA